MSRSFYNKPSHLIKLKVSLFEKVTLYITKQGFEPELIISGNTEHLFNWFSNIFFFNLTSE